ncbi:MAG: hypothetical protein ACE5K0_02785 [Candidatus Methanofastidiosia archaeon]
MKKRKEIIKHLKKFFSTDNLKSILKIGGSVGVTAGILLCFGFLDPQLVLGTLLSLEGTALYKLLENGFAGEKYDEKILDELHKEVRKNKNLQAEIASFFEQNWKEILSMMEYFDEDYKHFFMRNIKLSKEILEKFEISFKKIDELYGELKIKNFDIYLEYEDPINSFEDVKKNLRNADDIIDRPEVSRILEHFWNQNGILVLEGYPTSGKSFVAYLVAKRWLEEGGRIAVLRQGQILTESDAAFLGKKTLLTIADQNNELGDMVFKNLEQFARKCLITRRLGEFSRTLKVIESRLTEKFLQDEDYLYEAKFGRIWEHCKIYRVLHRKI